VSCKSVQCDFADVNITVSSARQLRVTYLDKVQLRVQGQIALRWNQQTHLQPSRGRTSPRKLLMTAVWVILVLALSFYATRATRASQIQVRRPVLYVHRSTSAELELCCCWTNLRPLGPYALEELTVMSVPCSSCQTRS